MEDLPEKIIEPLKHLSFVTLAYYNEKTLKVKGGSRNYPLEDGYFLTGAVLWP